MNLNTALIMKLGSMLWLNAPCYEDVHQHLGDMKEFGLLQKTGAIFSLSCLHKSSIQTPLPAASQHSSRPSLSLRGLPLMLCFVTHSPNAAVCSTKHVRNIQETPGWANTNTHTHTQYILIRNTLTCLPLHKTRGPLFHVFQRNLQIMNLAVIKVPCAPSAGLHPRRGRAAAAKTKSRCPWILPVGRHFVFSALPVKEHLDTLFERGSGISIRPMAGPERRKAIDPWAFPASHPVTLSDPLTHSSPGSAGPSYLMMADAAPCCTGTLLGVKSSSMYSPIHHFLVPAVLLRLGHHSPAWTDPGSLRENASHGLNASDTHCSSSVLRSLPGLG